ncbi:MAG: cytochrome c biogenesis protein CcdA, partial [Anaerolineae bacterium]|nr:cytochrome c biogenesis protein CcdA [Anaerolineae bacterium]
MNPESVTFPTAFVAGLLSFFSPCILPLVPVYLGYMAGTAASNLGQTKRLRVLGHAFFFVLGFGLVFVLLGAAAGLLGHAIDPIMPYVIKVGGLILIIFGLHMMGMISIPSLNMEKRLEIQEGKQGSYWSSFLIGVVFAAGWTPCVGPVLSAILILAANSQTATTGAGLLAIYAAGLGIPFLLVAGLINAALPLLRRASRYLHIASVIGGILLVLMGFLLLTGLFT